METGRVFVIESPNPIDLLKNRGERSVLEQVCKLLGYSATTFLVKGISDFVETCSYISSIPHNSQDTTPLFLHISMHGNRDGLALGRDDLSWNKLAEVLQEMYDELQYYKGVIILIISACGANNQQLTDILTKKIAGKSENEQFVPPEYMFVFSDDTVSWQDAAVAWTIFYRQVIGIKYNNFSEVQEVLRRIYNSKFGNLKYFRWDGKKYRYYDPSSSAKPQMKINWHK